MNRNLKLTYSGMFLAIGTLLPLLTGQIKEIGDSLLPMHLTIMLCGLICGWKYGLIVGLILPFFRSVTFGMPPIYPQAVWMALELATYGAVIALMYDLFKRKNIGYLYLSLVISMISGRIVWGITKALLLGIANKPFTFEAFIVGGFVDAVPGIILQLILVPCVMLLVERIRRK
ncbi:MAG: ECF transporter S component [Clostridia bacterium]|nr:ECF transporter S component [Clostridia bacterium]